jgi:hypothetical protein
MNRFTIPTTLAALLVTASLSNAQVSYTGGVYSQNFDTLQGTTNNTTGVTWTNNVTLPGWYSSHTSYGVTNATMGGSVATFDGTATAANVGLFSFGTAGSTDRALGSRATSQVAGNTNIYYGVRLVNNTAQTISSFTVTFTGEQWHKNGGTTAHTLPVQYLLGATDISTGTWTSVATFTSPVNTTTIATLDGNAAANRRGVSGKISGISWAPGAELWVRVADGNESGNEQALGIDDFYFIADNESGLAFNGNTSYVSMGFGATTASLNTSSFTVECRFMRTGPGVTASTGTGGVTTAIPLVTKGVGEADGSNVDANYFLGIDNATGKLCADFEQLNATVDPNGNIARAAGQNFPVFGSTVLQNGVFYHVAATYDTATAVWKLFVNGVEETTTQTLPTFVGVVPRSDNTQGLGIGTTVNSTGARSGFFHGIIDEARIWNYARSATEINTNKDVAITSATGLLGRYGFNEATGTTAAGTNASGAAAPVGTLAGTVLPVWVNSKSLVANTLPTVALTAPANNSSVIFPAAVNLSATATDTDGSIAKVEFFQGTTKLGEDLTGPSYDFTWNGAAVGNYTLTAVATDNAGGVTTSSVVNFTVNPNPNQPPVVTLTAPADNATGIGASTTLSVSLTDNENDAQTVTFYGRKTTPATPGPDFTIGTLPDTQFYSEGGVTNNGRGPTFAAQTHWYLDNRNSVDMPNLAFISHMGDIVEHGDATPNEWLIADAAMKVIENPATSLRPYGIAYGVTPGNHDFGTGGGTGTTIGFNQYFGIPRFLGRSYYGGGYGGNNLTSYQLFSASGLDFIAISFEYNTGAKSTYQAQLDWADALLKTYPNHRAIITTHWMVNTGNPASFSNQGSNIYNDLKDNPNLFLMLGGHVHGEGQRSDTFGGRTVHTVLQDYQGRTNGGDGWLRYFVFSPANNTINARTYRVSNPLNPAAGTYETDADSQFTLSYPMQSAVTGWIPLGTVNVPANGTTASLNWTGLEKGSDYEWYASSNDGVNTSNSSTRRFTTTANQAPLVSLTAPANNASFTAPAAFTLTADATDSDDGIAKVEFYQGSVKLGEDTASPYEFNVTGLLVGNYAYTAIAIDAAGKTTLSSVVNVSVNASQPPTVVLTSPTQGDTFDAPASITVTADAQDADGSIALVEFFNGAVKIGEDTDFPYSITWTGVITGSYTLTAKATDNAATTTTSAAVTISVTNANNVAPSVAITAPSNGTTFAAGSSVNLAANAADTDGVISKVEFYQGVTKLGEDTAAPFTFTWSNVAAGNYALTAVATDNDGGTTTSSTVNVISDANLWAYTQNFDGMGTGTAAPAGWSFYGAFGGSNSTFTDSIPINTASGGTLNNTLTASSTFTTSSNTAGFNFLVPSTTTNRALGTSPTTGQFVALQLSLTNPTGAPLSALRMSYDIHRFTAPASANELPGYALFYSLDNGSTWTNVPAFTPTIANVPNTIGVTNIPATTFNLASPWAAGATLLFRWLDDNAVATSPDQIHGLDNVSITVPIGQPPLASLTAPVTGSVAYVGDTISLTATASDPDGSITKVEFFQGNTKLGEDLTGPSYSYDWSGFGVGTYSLTARSTDNDGNTTTSNVSSVNIFATPGSGTLTRSPYLNSPGPNSIVVRWKTSQQVVGRVRYGTSSSNLDQITNESTARTDHEVKLTGLSPYTRYYYSVGSAFDTLTPETAETTSFSPGAPVPTAADYTFRTSPTPGTAVNTRIWIIGDCGRGTQVQANGRDAYYTSSFTGGFTGTRIPDLNLQLGDNAYNAGTESEYQTGYFNMYANIFRKMPQMSTLGNHDANNTTPGVDGNYSYPYFNMFTFPTAGEIGGVASGTEHYYSFDYGNIHFICLDSNSSTRTVDNPATIGVNEDAPMAAWLRQDLASTTATWIIAFWHHPSYSKGSHDSDTEAAMVQMRERFNPILENGGVDLVFVGHSHNYERSVLLDGHYSTSGTITPAMKKNAGNGSTTGITTVTNGKIRNAANNFTATATTATTIPADGAYIKPLTGPRDRFGAVYNTAGMSGLADAGSIDHSAMYVSYNNVGTVNLDVNGNSLTCTFVQSGGATPDNFTITKQGAADTDGDGISDAYEIANGLNRYVNDASSDKDMDGLSNFLEFAFGLNASVNDAGPVIADVPGGTLTQPGQPAVWYQTTNSGTDFRVIYTRRKDYIEAGLVYTPRFSGDMVNWANSNVTPTVIATVGDIELVSIRYPFFAAGRKARFFQMGVSSNH